MRLFTKILFASCLFIQTHPSSAMVAESMTPIDANSESIQVMEKLKELLKQNDQQRAIRLINGFENSNQDSTDLVVEQSFGTNPLMYVEVKNGKITVLASRNPKEINLDLTDDKTHQAIVQNLKNKIATTVYYTDKKGREIELLAVTPKYFAERKEAPEVTPEAPEVITYWATEKEVTRIPEGATVVK